MTLTPGGLVNPPLNLTPQRGPSVWGEPPHQTTSWPLAALGAGSLLTIGAWCTVAPKRFWIAGLGVGGLALALLNGPFAPALDEVRGRARVRRQARDADPLDRTLEESFPASDPPAVN
jgi:hypothetical protein